jgi:hypothetical protein
MLFNDVIFDSRPSPERENDGSKLRKAYEAIGIAAKFRQIIGAQKQKARPGFRRVGPLKSAKVKGY